VECQDYLKDLATNLCFVECNNALQASTHVIIQLKATAVFGEYDR
jgi:hypothetical protein